MWLIAVVFFGSIAVYIYITTIIDIMLMGKITPRIPIKIGCIMFLSLDLMTDMYLLQNRYRN